MLGASRHLAPVITRPDYIMKLRILDLECIGLIVFIGFIGL